MTNETVTDETFPDFLDGYVASMCWANAIGPDGQTSGGHDWQDIRDDLSDDVLAELEKDARDFLHFGNGCSETAEYLAEYGAETFGHDLGLSRNGHGAGFFDRGRGFPRLQSLAKSMGERTLYVGGDGAWHLA